MKCPNCSTQLLGSMKKCPKCGYNTETGQIDNAYVDRLDKSKVAPKKDHEYLGRYVGKVLYKGYKHKIDIRLCRNGDIKLIEDLNLNGTYTTVRAISGLLGAAIYKSVHTNLALTQFNVSQIVSVTESSKDYTKGGWCFALDNGDEIDMVLSESFFQSLTEYMGI